MGWNSRCSWSSSTARRRSAINSARETADSRNAAVHVRYADFPAALAAYMAMSASRSRSLWEVVLRAVLGDTDARRRVHPDVLLAVGGPQRVQQPLGEPFG